MKRNRFLYGFLLLGTGGAAIIYGDPFMYMTFYALLAMPAASLIFACFTLFGLHVHQRAEKTTVVKEEPNHYIIRLANRTPLGFGTVRCHFVSEHFAVETGATGTTGAAGETGAAQREVMVRPFMRPQTLTIDFIIKYRGEYKLGIQALEIKDFLGLFRLRRKIPAQLDIIAYPKIKDLAHLRFAIHLLSKAPANMPMAQEDYADVTDVRPYAPADPIKKVHWKLTAKRGEWIVKNYQTSALNTMTVLIDSNKRTLPYEASVKLEDQMMEYGVSIVRFCLRQQMPIELLFGQQVREMGQHIGDFEALYNIMANLAFEDTPFSLHSAVDGYLNEMSRNVNMVILTTTLTAPLYERILNAVRFGHYIAVMYFIPEGRADAESDAIYMKLTGSGLNCVRLDGDDEKSTGGILM